MKQQRCVYEEETGIETIDLTGCCPFMYPCGRKPCEMGKMECPGRQDLKMRYPTLYGGGLPGNL